MTIDVLRPLVVARFPDLADASFTLLAAGWDSVALDVDDRLIFKFPRSEVAAAALRREARFLDIIRPVVSMPVPALVLYETPRLFSRHAKLSGDHLVTAEYDALPVPQRNELAGAMALFYSQIHSLPTKTMADAGAKPIGSWLDPEAILHGALPLLPAPAQDQARRIVSAWQALPPDPYGEIYGFFDGHGWNMAFDHAAGRLNGIYDFADSGFGDLQQDFVYGNFISRDLTARTITAYEEITGKAIDRERVEVLSGVLRLSELAEQADDLEHRDWLVNAVLTWIGAA